MDFLWERLGEGAVDVNDTVAPSSRSFTYSLIANWLWNLLCRLGWSGTPGDPPVSALPSAGISEQKVSATMPNFKMVGQDFTL